MFPHDYLCYVFVKKIQIVMLAGHVICQQVLTLIISTLPIHVDQDCHFAFVTKHFSVHQEWTCFNVYKCFSTSVFPPINISCNYAEVCLIYLFMCYINKNQILFNWLKCFIKYISITQDLAGKIASTSIVF